MTRKLSDLQPNRANPRKISEDELGRLKKSLAEFGDISGFVWNQVSGNLVGGHQRQKVLPPDAKVVVERHYEPHTGTGTVAEGYVEVGEERYRYREVAWDSNKEKAANIAANQHGGEFDNKLLADWLIELDGANVDIDLIGFTEEEIENVVAPYKEMPEGDGDPDAVPEPPKIAKTKRGELWILGSHRVLCGDCTDVSAVDRLFNGLTAELCFTSPPYSDQRDYSGGLQLEPSHLANFLSSPCRLFAVNLGIKKTDHEIVPYWDAYITKAKSFGLKLLSWNVWDKMQSGSVGHQCMMFPLEHEWIFIFGKAPKDLNETEDTVWGGIGKTGASRNKDGTIQVRPKQIVGMKKPVGTVLRQFPEKARNHGFDHPAMFPVAFPKKYVEACTKSKDIVYEPFCGSGTTLIACSQTGRQCLGMEIDPVYLDIILKRWADFTHQDPVREDGVKWSELSGVNNG